MLRKRKVNMKIQFSNIAFKVQVGEETKTRLAKVKGWMFELPKYSKRKFVENS